MQCWALVAAAIAGVGVPKVAFIHPPELAPLVHALAGELKLRVPEVVVHDHVSANAVPERSLAVSVQSHADAGIEMVLRSPEGERLFRMHWGPDLGTTAAPRQLALVLESYLRLDLWRAPASESRSVAVTATTGVHTYAQAPFVSWAVLVRLTAMRWSRWRLHALVAGEPMGRSRDDLTTQELISAVTVSWQLLETPVRLEIEAGPEVTLFTARRQSTRDFRVSLGLRGGLELGVPLSSRWVWLSQVGASWSASYPAYGTQGRVTLGRGPWRLAVFSGIAWSY